MKHIIIKNRIEYALIILTLSSDKEYTITSITHGVALTLNNRMLCKIENEKFYLCAVCLGSSEAYAVNAFLQGADIPLSVLAPEVCRKQAYYDTETGFTHWIANNKRIQKIEPRIHRRFDGQVIYRKGLL